MTYTPLARIDHIQRGLSKFLEQFKGKPFLDGMVRPWLRKLQQAEDALWEINNSRALADREGVSLDMLGRIVGRGRGDLSDADYRIAIQAQIRINRSSGDTHDLIDIGILSLPNGAYWEYSEYYPASIFIYLAASLGVNAGLFFENLRRAKPAGVRLQVAFWFDPMLPDNNGAFIWDVAPSTPDNFHGWGTVTQMPDPEVAVGGIGGVFSHVFNG